MMARSHEVVCGANRRAVVRISRSLSFQVVLFYIGEVSYIQNIGVLTTRLDGREGSSVQEGPQAAEVRVAEVVDGTLGGLYVEICAFAAVTLI